MNRSLRSRLLLFFSLSILISVVALGFVFWNSWRLQDIADQRFSEEQQLQEIQQHLDNIQPALRKYLSSWSSASLSVLLFNTESLKDLIPQERPIIDNERELAIREIYFLIDTYLVKVTETIDQKRGRKVEEYSRNFEELIVLHQYIGSRLDAASLLGFRVQLGEYNRFLDVFRRVQLYNLLQILISTFFAYTLLLQSVNTINKPLYQLSEMAAALSAGDFDIPDIHLSSIQEVSHVAEAFNDMKHSIRHYVEELKNHQEMEQQVMNERLRNMNMEQLLKRMELYTMQAQMNPHFLFNTLNTGVQLAIVEDADKTAEFMEKLATLFRYNIREKKFFVPLRYEIEGLQTYFDILKIRFPKTLTLELSVRDDLLDRFECPAMVIQPLVENSVLHAFKGMEEPGVVSVFVGFEDPVLIISVKDNGVGIPEKTRRALLVPHTHDYQLSSKVMGLENVIQRCYFYYPDSDDVIEIQSEADKGTEIIIRIDTETQPCIES